eukprot:2937528-Ditylum_brightwellii.AAC.2
MMHVELVVDVGDNYCPKECLLGIPVLAAYNMPPVGPERMFDSIPEADKAYLQQQWQYHVCR